MMTDGFLVLLVTMAAVSFGCRAAGFLAMRFIPMGARVREALNATPVAVMAGITAITAAGGKLAELLAIGAVIACMRITGNDVLSALAGVAIVAALRHLTA